MNTERRLSTMFLISPVTRKTLCWVGAGLVSSVATHKTLRRFVWKYPLDRDRSVDAPLPEGHYPLCPLFKDNPREATPEFGSGVFFHRRSQQLKHSRIWKFLNPKNNPVVVLSGYNNSKAMLSMEFTSAVKGQVEPFTSKIVGTDSLRLTQDRKEHLFLRKLVGSGMTPSNVAKMVDKLQTTAETLLSSLEKERQWKIHEICTDFTLNVATKQIIGIPMEDVAAMRTTLFDWMDGIFNADQTKALDARVYLVEKIEARIADLEKSSSVTNNDGSALANMVFAVDDEDQNRRLTKGQIIDNTLLLILAGSETSAGTLTTTLMLLGINPEKYQRLVQEQKQVMEKHGGSTALTQQILDNDMSYTDAVIKEALRIRPIPGGSMRGTQETIVIDGKQIPAGYALHYDRHLTHLLDPTTYQEDESNMDIYRGFQPERWLEDDTRPTREFIPFGVGPRYCLGAELALVEMKVFLAVLVRRLDRIELLDPKSDEPILWKEGSLMQVPKNGVVIDAANASVSVPS